MNLEKFFKTFNRQGPVLKPALGPCWVWLKSVKDDGYGQVWYDGKVWRTHILMWTILFGPVPEGQEVCHHCDNPICSRPSHLFVDTHKGNYADAVSKGRIAHGENHYAVKLNAEKVFEIRKRYVTGEISQYVLAQEYGVSRGAIKNVVLRNTWKHI